MIHWPQVRLTTLAWGKHSECRCSLPSCPHAANAMGMCRQPGCGCLETHCAAAVSGSPFPAVIVMVCGRGCIYKHTNSGDTLKKCLSMGFFLTLSHMMSRFFCPKGLVFVSFFKTSVEAAQCGRKPDRAGSSVCLFARYMILGGLIL